MKLSMENGTCGYNKKVIIDQVSIHVKQGEIVGILGQNGIGKTTIFRSMLGLLKLLGGQRLLDDIPVERLSVREFARQVAYVPQSHGTAFSFSVRDVVVMGRASYLGPFQSPDKKSYDIAEQVMHSIGIPYLLNSNYDQISGGEKQMVLVARALTQEPHILMMDEPTANLDFGNQIRVLSCIRKLANNGLGVLMTTHNPDHVFLCCDRVILLNPDHSVLEGDANQIITEENLYRAYGVHVRILSQLCNDGSVIKSCVPTLEDESSWMRPNPEFH